MSSSIHSGLMYRASSFNFAPFPSPLVDSVIGAIAAVYVLLRVYPVPFFSLQRCASLKSIYSRSPSIGDGGVDNAFDVENLAALVRIISILVLSFSLVLCVDYIEFLTNNRALFSLVLSLHCNPV
nr:hypothetical protein Iba_chr10fCG8800 [Ipomoea batatas]